MIFYAKYLFRQTGVDNDAKIGSVGFCWGGSKIMSLAGGEFGPDIGGACASVHGSFLTPEMAEKATCPLMIMPSGKLF